MKQTLRLPAQKQSATTTTVKKLGQ
jgi:hypothetical protein